MRKDWRFLDTGENSGAFNMALDEAMLNLKEKNPEMPPTLRVFRWKPACLSLGRNQGIGKINLAKCRELGIDVARRLTGGTAILHKEELTYSIVISRDDGIPFGIADSFQILNQGLIAAYKELRVELNLVFHQEKSSNAFCFVSAGIADLTYRGKKIIGSAQTRRGRTILQHGALVIKHRPDLMLEILNIDEAQREKIREDFLEKTTDLEKIRGETDWLELKGAIKQGFKDAFGINFLNARVGTDLRFVYDCPTPEEISEAKNLFENYLKLE